MQKHILNETAKQIEKLLFNFCLGDKISGEKLQEKQDSIMQLSECRCLVCISWETRLCCSLLQHGLSNA